MSLSKAEPVATSQCNENRTVPDFAHGLGAPVFVNIGERLARLTTDNVSMDKESLTEQDIRTKYVTPALAKSGWDITMQVREAITFTAGRVKVRGRLVARER
jgi:hypothetical protein